MAYRFIKDLATGEILAVKNSRVEMFEHPEETTPIVGVKLGGGNFYTIYGDFPDGVEYRKNSNIEYFNSLVRKVRKRKGYLHRIDGWEIEVYPKNWYTYSIKKVPDHLMGED